MGFFLISTLSTTGVIHNNHMICISRQGIFFQEAKCVLEILVLYVQKFTLKKWSKKLVTVNEESAQSVLNELTMQSWLVLYIICVISAYQQAGVALWVVVVLLVLILVNFLCRTRLVCLQIIVYYYLFMKVNIQGCHNELTPLSFFFIDFKIEACMIIYFTRIMPLCVEHFLKINAYIYNFKDYHNSSHNYLKGVSSMEEHLPCRRLVVRFLT